MEPIYIKTLADLHAIIGYKEPKHPLISVLNFAESNFTTDLIEVELLSPFYIILLYNKIIHSSFSYGRKNIDLKEGTLVVLRPDQIVQVYEIFTQEEVEVWGIIFHPDLIRSSLIYEQVIQYNFLAYNLNEALEISEQEEKIIRTILDNILEEYSQIDDYSTTIWVNQIILLFTYIQRFYDRQFMDKKLEYSNNIIRFEKILKACLKASILEKKGIPTVEQLAKEMNLSRNYLGNLLKKETGKSTLEHIHYQIINKAKTLLVNSNDSVAEIAFQLGFEYAQYFSRLFKKKVGVTPSEYRKLV
ncbi:helix-turn-helix domain-containing protein [Aureispira anguillae]|uniref:Helix-turn-helix transcriptional regulator n=1 Tax=Aureispira anguillae TaxID=2864201 RepID=A0A915VMF9_9BACT|nr:helix-turn-helix transcriptional regulator [Aureispira anguillae]BDS09400.1 helix-turn-helix transcriptional regulator [Aureispira anguillae]